MRIIQLSDIHLNNSNLEALRNYYMEALIRDLLEFHVNKPIDIILITGDLIDKGGDLLVDPYNVFKVEIIDRIVDGLGIKPEQVLMLPGNHDIERSKIKEETEYFLAGTLNSESANSRCSIFVNEFNDDNNRIKRFKEFEKEFHQNTPDYIYSNNESLVCIDSSDGKVGIALINDSWRCSSKLKKEQHFIGFHQLLKARNHFNKVGTVLNIAAFHHPLNALNDVEREEISNVLKTKNFDIAFFGHSHRHEADNLSSAVGGYLSINGRSALSEPKETSSKYQPGYNILDIFITEKEYTLIARKYISSDYRFDKYTDSLPDGFHSSNLPHNDRLFPLAHDSNNEDKDLPDSYTADVDRIVSLLIGQSIYPDRYTFLRELIQNSVDACNRVIEVSSHKEPKIIININSTGNYVEIVDEGDGMSKSIIKNQFSVLGKSISQEYNNNNGKFDLISMFGIGFISTFIAAEKVIINTKSENDAQIMFEIENVFKGFTYIQPPTQNLISSTGTTIRVYFKKGFDAHTAYNIIRVYCRHIKNLTINYNNSIIRIEDSWGIENSFYQYTNENNLYKLCLGIGSNSGFFIASYCGFLINRYPHQIIPFRFPVHIRGEINFKPRAIDFDVSRTNIMPTPKADNFKKEISLSLRKLFRDVLENKSILIIPQIVSYLHYYLQNYDPLLANFENSYMDFYSKKELIALCSEYTFLKYKNIDQSLSSILSNMKAKSINQIYYPTNNETTDYEKVVIQYLESKEYLIVPNLSSSISFYDASNEYTNLITVVQIIAIEFGIHVFALNQVPPNVLLDMKLDKTDFEDRLQNHISEIEKDFNVNVEIGKFNTMNKPSFKHGNQIYLNFNHETFQSILDNIQKISDENLKTYLLGISGLKLS